MKPLRIALIACALTLGGVALAQAGPGGHGGPPPGLRELMEELNLTDAQQKMVDGLRDSHKEMRERQHQAREEAGDLILGELAKEKPDAKAIHKLIDQNIAELSADLHNRADEALAFQATLSPEQRETLVNGLKDLRDERDQRRDEFMDERGERRGPPPPR